MLHEEYKQKKKKNVTFQKATHNMPKKEGVRRRKPSFYVSLEHAKAREQRKIIITPVIE